MGLCEGKAVLTMGSKGYFEKQGIFGKKFTFIKFYNLLSLVFKYNFHKNIF